MSKITFLRVHENGKTTSYTFSKKVLILFCLYNILLPIVCALLLFGFFSKYAEHYILQEDYAKQSHKLALIRSDLQKINNYITYLEESGEENLAETLRKNAPPSILEAPKEEILTDTSDLNDDLAANDHQVELSTPSEVEQTPTETAPLAEENANSIAQTTTNSNETIITDETIKTEETAPQENVEAGPLVSENTLEDSQNSNTQNTSLDIEAFNAAEEALPIVEVEKVKEEVIFEPINKNIVDPRSIQTSISPNKETVNVSFALYNVSGKSVAGDCTFTLFKGGNPGDTRQLIKQNTATSFNIKNMKNIDTTLLPNRGLITESDTIKLDIYVGEELVYSQIIPLA